MSQPLRVVGYLARAHGLAGLSALLSAPRYAVAAVFTHSRKPKSEDPARGPRPDFARYEALSLEHGFPLYAMDSATERAALPARLHAHAPDLLLSISWRWLISRAELDAARLGGVNLHRGRLPEYAGALPVARAIANGDAEVTVTAHELSEVIDGGRVLFEATHPVRSRAEEDVDAAAERVKQEITPLFAELTLRALDQLVRERG